MYSQDSSPIFGLDEIQTIGSQQIQDFYLKGRQIKNILVDDIITKRIAGIPVQWGNETEIEIIFEKEGSPLL